MKKYEKLDELLNKAMSTEFPQIRSCLSHLTNIDFLTIPLHFDNYGTQVDNLNNNSPISFFSRILNENLTSVDWNLAYLIGFAT